MKIIAGLLLLLCTVRDTPATPIGAAPAAHGGKLETGPAACAECHEPQYERWRGSHHDRAMQVASPETVLGDFGGETFTTHGVTSTFSRHDGKYFVRTEGPDGNLADYEIAYTFGVEPLQQYLVRFPGGRMQALGIAWDTRPKAEGGQRWFHLHPDEKIGADDVLHWTGPAQTWNSMCAVCHSTNLRKSYRPAGNLYETSWSEIDVTCEACHGPGGKHVEWARARAKDSSPGETLPPLLRGEDRGEVKADAQASTSVVNATVLDASSSRSKVVGDLSPHPSPLLEGEGAGGDSLQEKGRSGLVPFGAAGPSVWVMQPETGIAARQEPLATRVEVETCAPCHSRRRSLTDSQVPGEPLLASYRPALLDEGLYHADGQIEDEVYEYGSFVQSRMYRAGVTCSDCHDPHSLALHAAGNALCARCHLTAKFDTPSHHHHASGSPGAECVACHMRAKTYMVIDRRRDHSFRVPRPDLTVEIGTPNACADCHADRPAKWAADAVRSWFGPKAAAKPHFGVAIHAGREVLADAEKRLTELAANPGEPGIARATALALLAGYPSPRSAAVIEQAARDGDPLVRMAAAGAETLPPEMRAHALAPLLADPLLAVREQAAVSLASVPPGALSLTQQAALDRVLDEVRATERINSDRPDAHVNLGLLELRLGHQDAARKHYERALEIGAYFLPAYVNLADLDRSEGREAEGEELLRAALGRDPSNADVHHALGLLLVRRGRKAEAIEEFRLAAGGSTNPRHTYVYAVALHDAGRPDRALEVLGSNHRRHPGHQETLLGLVTFNREQGALDAAVGYAESLVALTPGDPNTLALLRELESVRAAEQKPER